MVVVPDMHTRKRLMFERSDAFVALPGGIGTLEELVEQMTWVQLDQHTKPVLIADIGGFWRPLLSLLDHMREQGFVRSDVEVRYSWPRPSTRSCRCSGPAWIAPSSGRESQSGLSVLRS